MIEQFFTGSSICNANNAQCSVRLENLDSWKQPYITVKGEYLNALKEYLKQKLSGTPNDAHLKVLKDNVGTTYNALQDHLTVLKNHNQTISTSIGADAASIGNNEQIINSNNARIMNQDSDINKLNISLVSKERQISYTTERNRNRRIMIAILILVNIILLAAAYFIYTADS